MPPHTLPPDALAALRQGEKVKAIQFTRESSGLSLKESKDLVERYINGEAPQAGLGAPGDVFTAALHGDRAAGALPPAALAALRQGQVLETVRLTREATGLSLKKVKDLVDAVRLSEAQEDAAPPAARTGALIDPLHEPGRVHDGRPTWALIAVVLLCTLLAAWLLFGR